MGQRYFEHGLLGEYMAFFNFPDCSSASRGSNRFFFCSFLDEYKPNQDNIKQTNKQRSFAKKLLERERGIGKWL